MREHLLTPSLSATTRPVTLYSVQSSFLIAFLGGPVAILLYSSLNSWRLRRTKDIPVILLGAGAVVGLVYALLFQPMLFAGLVELLGNDTFRALRTVLSLAICGVFYGLHQKQHRSAAFFHDKPPSPWIPALVCIVVGYVSFFRLFDVIKGIAS